MTDSNGIKYVTFGDLDGETQKMIQESVKARELAYCPYSNFKVGAALMTSSGILYTGCNIENASYTPSICAERTAMAKAISSGEMDFKAISVSGGDGDYIASPCGVCRQFISEFSKGKNISIFIASPNLKNIVETSIKSLLPLSFHL